MSEMSPLMPVEEALKRILGGAKPVRDRESVPLRQAAGRTLARDLVARRTQPPVPVSAMDGYAVRAADVATAPARLTLIGESAAGRSCGRAVGPGDAIRIFTGAPLPVGADAILIQENAEAVDSRITALRPVGIGQHIRAAGQDFRQGETLLHAGWRLDASAIALAAAMNYPDLPCFRRPKVAILATGDELVFPGEEPGPDRIVASNSFALAAIVEEAGAEVIDLGIARDTLESLKDRLGAAQHHGADLLITLGGASVGDHDLVQRALLECGMSLDFWRIAMRPGKPLMHGRLSAMEVLGLPGNPVSAIVCGILFAKPLVRALAGGGDADADPTDPAILGAPLPANDGRQDYLRARLVRSGGTFPEAVAEPRQDSSLLKVLSEADCLIIRPPYAPAAASGEACRIIRL